MSNKIARRTQSFQNPTPECQPWRIKLVHELPDVPVLPETLLRLDLASQEPCIDLRAISELVLSDLGATVQILRLAGREYGNTEGRPSRIEDCISDLGVQACLEAVSAQTAPLNGHAGAIAETWAHSWEIARYSRLLADDIWEVNPEEAYLVGLLHTIGSLPAVLGWDKRATRWADDAKAGLEMARNWSLSPCVVEFFSEMRLSQCRSWLPEILRKAHRLAARTSVPCPFEHESHPMLHMVV